LWPRRWHSRRKEQEHFSAPSTTGYRFTDINGYEPKFQELFDLNSGLRLLDLNMFGQAKTRFIDHYSLTLSGIGGEPYNTAQLNVRKTRLYDLRVNFRQSHYYWNRNDRGGTAQRPAFPDQLSRLGHRAEDRFRQPAGPRHQ
jgi:hypothetical protein